MNTRHYLLGTYRVMLQLYPPMFRRRFGSEMLEVAEAAEPAEWPLIFGDTSVAIVRCWIEGSPSTAALPEPNAYLPVGASSLPVLGFLRGFILSTAIILGLLYTGYRWPPPCPAKRRIVTEIVGPSQASLSAIAPRESVVGRSPGR
jgi:hypothetical protein